MESIDEKINESWTRLKNTHNQDQVVRIDAPLLEELMEQQSNKDELRDELKNLIMRWYWNGYYQGYEAGNKS